MKINAKQLSFLLSVTVRSANIMICRAIHGDNEAQIKVEIKMNKNCSADVDLVEKSTRIPIKWALTDLRENALKRSAFAKHLMRDYVEKQLNVKKPKKIIRLPPVLRSMLSKETLVEVESYWNQNYSGKKISAWGTDVDYFPNLRP